MSRFTGYAALAASDSAASKASWASIQVSSAAESFFWISPGLSGAWSRCRRGRCKVPGPLS